MPGIEKIAEHEIDNAIAAAEGHGRFGPLLRERIQPGAFAARQNKGQDAHLHSHLLWQGPSKFRKISSEIYR